MLVSSKLPNYDPELLFQVAYSFTSLKHKDRVIIGSELMLISEMDANLSEDELEEVIFVRAINKGVLQEFLKRIHRLEYE